MNRLVILLIAAALLAWWLIPARGSLESLEARARRVRAQENVSQRSQVHAFYRLADAYARAGRDAERLRELAHALSLDPGSSMRQVEAARLEVAAGRLADAHDRLAAVREGGSTPESRAQAGTLLDELRARGFTPAPVAAPPVVDRWMVFVAFAGTDRALVRELAARVGVAFGLKTRVREDAVAPLRSGARQATWAPGGEQLEADQLVGQLAGLAAATKSDPDVLATIGVTASDLYAGQLNFLFGTAVDRLGVFSLARFSGKDDARETVLSRATKQAFSTAGFALGVPRCSSSACARAYPHSLAEMDRKGHALCRECRQRLDSALGRGRGPN